MQVALLQCFCNTFVALTIDSKSPVKQVLRSSDHSADHGQSSATVLVFLIGFAQQLRLKIPVILTPSATRKRKKSQKKNPQILHRVDVRNCRLCVDL